MALTTSSSSTSSQTTTQSPQTATGAGGASSGNLQPGVTGSELTGVGGVPVQSPVLPAIPLGSANNQTTASTGSAASVSTTTHHPQPVLLGASLGLLVIAAVLFWTTGRSAKNTTKYL